MEITIKINGRAVPVDVSYEVYEYLDESKRKTENLAHQKRRHWDEREFDEYIISTECTHIHIPTPEEILCHRETMSELMGVLATCTEVQQERFLLYARWSSWQISHRVNMLTSASSSKRKRWRTTYRPSLSSGIKIIPSLYKPEKHISYGHLLKKS